MATTVPVPRTTTIPWRDRHVGLHQVFTAVLALVAVAGALVWAYQVREGLVVTGMRDIASWGVYISFFMWFIGLSAGGLIVASAASILRLERLASLARPAIVVAFVAVAVGAVAIIPDIGRPDRLWHLFRYPNWSSPMVWDVIVIFAYGALSLVYLWFHTRVDLARRGSWLAFGTEVTAEAEERSERVAHRIAWVAFPLAIALHSITAWIFGLQASRPLWFGAILAPFFITSALVSGLGLVLVTVLALRRRRLVEADDATVGWLGGLLAGFIFVDLFLLVAELVTAYWSGLPEEHLNFDALVTGKYWWAFWGQVVLEVGAMALMLSPRRRARTGLVAVAGAMAMVGILFKRLGLVLVGFLYPLMDAAPGAVVGEIAETTPTGIPLTGAFATEASYVPTWAEYVIVAGLLAIAVLAIDFAARHLPLRRQS